MQQRLDGIPRTPPPPRRPCPDGTLRLPVGGDPGVSGGTFTPAGGTFTPTGGAKFSPSGTTFSPTGGAKFSP
ncbi:hypothetical protein ACFXB3_39220, partial [Streptomyces sp. NPDC059447]|uniref:hypothetical protein n=1 Tax=Streptomyces sp. NPDC059447 TaxID=3346834 RepID=UPI0036CA71CB